MKLRKLTTPIFLMGMAFSASGVQAATVSYMFGLPVVESTTEINQTGSLGLFDSTLGTLTGATLTLSGGATFSYTGENTAAQSQTAILTSSTNLVFSSSIAALTAIVGATPIALSSTSGVQTYASGETKSFGPDSQTDTQVDNLSSILASLQQAGGGTFSLTGISLSGFTVTGGGGNIATTQETSAGFGARIDYTYDVPPPPTVPEPATLALMGMGLAGFAAARRKKQA